MMEGFSDGRKKDVYFLSDYTEESYYPLLLQIPEGLRQRHLGAIEEGSMDVTTVHQYLSNVIEGRKEAMTETHISDEHLHELISNPDLEAEILRHIETNVFQSPSIGAGQTAKIKRYDLVQGTETIPMAVKYLLTPTAKTLSASGEHDMLREVERMQTIEEIERGAKVDLVRIPHPYLHHKNETIQCYAMELVNGANLLEVIEGTISNELLQKLTEVFSGISEEVIHREFEKFYATMHSYCLHGDMKPANLMVSEEGKFYVIDLGQSVLVADVDDTGREQLDNLKETEIEQTKLAVKMFLKKIQKMH